MKHRIDNLFPTPVSIIDIENPTLCSKYSDIIWSMVDKDDFNKSNQFSTPDNLHTLPEFKELYELIDGLAQSYFYENLKIEKNSLKMAAMWSNVSNYGQIHLPHVHANSYCSGVFYLNIPEGEGTYPGNIVFNDPRAANVMQEANHYSDCIYSYKSWFYNPRNGILMFFPSWLEHGVDGAIFEKGNKRISLSFNYILTRSSVKTKSFNLE